MLNILYMGKEMNIIDMIVVVLKIINLRILIRIFILSKVRMSIFSFLIPYLILISDANMLLNDNWTILELVNRSIKEDVIYKINVAIMPANM